MNNSESEALRGQLRNISNACNNVTGLLAVNKCSKYFFVKKSQTTKPQDQRFPGSFLKELPSHFSKTSHLCLAVFRLLRSQNPRATQFIVLISVWHKAEVFSGECLSVICISVTGVSSQIRCSRAYHGITNLALTEFCLKNSWKINIENIYTDILGMRTQRAMGLKYFNHKC